MFEPGDIAIYKTLGNLTEYRYVTILGCPARNDIYPIYQIQFDCPQEKTYAKTSVSFRHLHPLTDAQREDYTLARLEDRKRLEVKEL